MRRPDEETLVGSASSATSFLEPDGCAVQKFQCDPKSAAASPRKERSISLEQKQTGMLFKSKARTSLSMSSTHHQIKTGEFKTFLLSPENENIPKTGYNYTPKVRGLVLTWNFGRPRSQRYIYRLQKRFCITSGKNTQQNHTVAIWATHDLLSTDGRFAKIPHWRLIPYGALIGLGSFGDEDAHCRTGFKFH